MPRSVALLSAGALFIAALAFLLLRPDSDESRPTELPAAPAVRAPTVTTANTPQVTFRVRGRVEDERGAAVREAQLHAAAPPHGPVRTETDERGRFEIELPVSGDWQLAASAEGLLPWEDVVPVTTAEVEVVVKLRSGGQLAGQVRGNSDSAQYLVTVESESGEAQQTQSDPSGRYRFPVLQLGTYRVGLKSGGASWDDVGQVSLGAGERATFDIVVPETGGAIELTARLPSGGTAAHPARVELLELAAKRQSDRDVVLSADGHARIDGVPPGSYQLRVHAAAAPPSMIAPVEVQTGSTAHVTVDWGGASVAGRVTAPTSRGAPATVRVQRVSSRHAGAVPDAEVLFETLTSADGTYAIEGLLPGEYLVSARGGDGYVAARVHIVGSENAAVDLAFPATGQLEVSVETANGPVEGATVFAVREPLSDWAERGKTDAHGRARITSIPAGSYRVVATLANADAVRTAVARARISPGGQSTVALFVGSK